MSNISNLISLQKELFPLMSWLADTPATQEITAWSPKVDIKEEPKEFVVYADIPGVDPKEIEIEMEGDRLIVRGEKKSQKEEKGKNYYRMERTSGKFYRQFTLPDSVDSSKITAITKHGVLEIHLPKSAEGKHYRKIEIQQQEK